MSIILTKSTPEEEGISSLSLKDSFLSNFLTDDVKKNSPSLLKTAFFAYRAAEVALQDFKAKRFENFDALTGDTSCQIRATLISLYAKDPTVSEPIQKELDGLDCAGKLAKIIQLLTDGANFDPKDIDCPLSEKATFVVLARLLSVTKTIEKVTAAYTSKLMQKGGADQKKIQQMATCASCQEIVSYDSEKSTSEKLNSLIVNGKLRKNIISQNKDYVKLLDTITKAAKENLCALSCSLLQEQAARSKIDPFTQKMLSPGNIQKDGQNREQLPCFFVTRACFEIAIKEKIATLLEMKSAPHTVFSNNDPVFPPVIFRSVNGKDRHQWHYTVLCRAS